jgi:hypothetical protein
VEALFLERGVRKASWQTQEDLDIRISKRPTLCRQNAHNQSNPDHELDRSNLLSIAVHIYCERAWELMVRAAATKAEVISLLKSTRTAHRHAT